MLIGLNQLVVLLGDVHSQEAGLEDKEHGKGYHWPNTGYYIIFKKALSPLQRVTSCESNSSHWNKA
jgi:hypothetical protein